MSPSSVGVSALPNPATFPVGQPGLIDHYSELDKWLGTPRRKSPERHQRTTYEAWSRDAQLRYDRERLIHHQDLPLLRHALFDATWSEARRRLARLATAPKVGQPGVYIHGGGSTGKSTLVAALMAEVYRTERLNPPQLSNGGMHIPVVYIHAAAGMTPIDLALAGVSFFDDYSKRSDGLTKLENRFATLMNENRTRLIVIDEAHRLTPLDTAGRHLGNVIRNLQNTSRAGLLLAGVRQQLPGLLHPRGTYTEDDAEPLRRRIRTVPLRDHRPAERRDDFYRFLSRLSSEIFLLDEQPHDKSRLIKWADEIWTQAQGAVGPAINMVVDAAAEAIRSGEEKFTAQNLELDAAATRERLNEAA